MVWGKSRLEKFIRGEAESEATTSSEESSSEDEQHAIAIRDRAELAPGSEQTAPFVQTTTVVSKPPLPPRRPSWQSSLSSKSEKESEKAESEKAESETSGSIKDSDTGKQGECIYCHVVGIIRFGKSSKAEHNITL